MDQVENATPTPAVDEVLPWDEPATVTHAPIPYMSQAFTVDMPLTPSVWRSSGIGLVVVLRVGDGLSLSFTGASPDDRALEAVDHLIDAMQQLRRLVIEAQADPAIVAAVSEQVPS